MRKTTRHHRKPKALGGTLARGNVSHVPPKKHNAWHCLFPGNWTPQRIAEEINRTFLDPEYRFVVEKR